MKPKVGFKASPRAKKREDMQSVKEVVIDEDEEIKNSPSLNLGKKLSVAPSIYNLKSNKDVRRSLDREDGEEEELKRKPLRQSAPDTTMIINSRGSDGGTGTKEERKMPKSARGEMSSPFRAEKPQTAENSVKAATDNAATSPPQSPRRERGGTDNNLENSPRSPRSPRGVVMGSRSRATSTPETVQKQQVKTGGDRVQVVGLPETKGSTPVLEQRKNKAGTSNALSTPKMEQRKREEIDKMVLAPASPPGSIGKSSGAQMASSKPKDAKSKISEKEAFKAKLGTSSEWKAISIDKSKTSEKSLQMGGARKEKHVYQVKDKVWAEWEEDRLWYRAEILDKDSEKGLYTILFTEYGNTQVCKRSKLRPLDNDVLLTMSGMTMEEAQVTRKNNRPVSVAFTKAMDWDDSDQEEESTEEEDQTMVAKKVQEQERKKQEEERRKQKEEEDLKKEAKDLERKKKEDEMFFKISKKLDSVEFELEESNNTLDADEADQYFSIYESLYETMYDEDDFSNKTDDEQTDHTGRTTEDFNTDDFKTEGKRGKERNSVQYFTDFVSRIRS